MFTTPTMSSTPLSNTPFLPLAAGTLLLAVSVDAQVGSAHVAGNPTELGKVTWIRDHDEALARSRKTNKPIFLLFQEVPG